MELMHPWLLLLLLILPVLAFIKLKKHTLAAIRFPSLKDVRQCPVSLRQRLRPILNVARFLCIALLIVSIARPRKGTVLSEISSEGVAIEVVADRSSSMLAEMDYFGEKLNRFDVVKKVFEDFIAGNKKNMKGRSGDLVGLITFARYADTICPLVLSHNVLIEFLKRTEVVNLRSEDGTAIGDAIALGAARLKKAEEEILQRKARLIQQEGEDDSKQESGFKIKSKVIVLLTDGINNAGKYNPIQAAELAKDWGIKIYTIGIGSGQSYTTIQTPMGEYKVPARQQLDETMLKTIAENTGGFYGRASNAKSLVKIVEKINDLERTEVKTIQYAQYSERFGLLTLGALVLLVLEILGRCTVFRKIP